MTRPLWGIVILRHGGESRASRDAYRKLSPSESDALHKFLNSLILFPPDDTASNLDPGNHATPNFPQAGHGSIKADGLVQRSHRSGVRKSRSLTAPAFLVGRFARIKSES